jgi:hypothetical protein
MLTTIIENLKFEWKNIKFLERRELQQMAIIVLIIGLFSAIGFSVLDLILNYIIHKILFV